MDPAVTRVTKVLVGSNPTPLKMGNNMIRLIGDVHGKHSQYLDLIAGQEKTLQVGDFGFNYDILQGVDAKKHRILAGNHDNYTLIKRERYNHFLGDYGYISEGEEKGLFFIRGGRSVDKHLRTEGETWWSEEELTYEEGSHALRKYCEAKPHFVVSHECPMFLVAPYKDMGYSKTAQLLKLMWEAHHPRMWVFGHHHQSFMLKMGGTQFVCLNELEAFDTTI